jgi:hypothetical protein
MEKYDFFQITIIIFKKKLIFMSEGMKDILKMLLALIILAILLIAAAIIFVNFVFPARL